MSNKITGFTFFGPLSVSQGRSANMSHNSTQKTISSGGNNSLQDVQLFNTLLEMLDCSAVLTDRHGHIDHTHGDLSPYVVLPDTGLTEKLSVTELAHRELRYPLQLLLCMAAENSQETHNKTIIFDGGRQMVSIKVRNVSPGQQHHGYLLTFTSANSTGFINQFKSTTAKTDQQYIAELKQDLKYKGENLLITTQQLEANAEELQMLNEELRVLNEELQASNEELNSANEELRARADENAELIDNLSESEARYRTIGEAIAYGVWVADGAGNCTYCSPSFLEMSGMTMAQIQQSSWLQLLPEEDIKPTMEHWTRCVESGDDFNREHRFTAVDGSTRYVLAMGRAIRDNKGRITSWVGINLDISDLKETEITLQKSRKTLQSALASMTDAVFIFDSDGKLIDFNDAFVTFHRYADREECVNSLNGYSEIFDLFKENGKKATLEEWPASLALHGRDNDSAEYTLRRRDTGETWVGNYTYAPILDDNGNITGSVMSARDITHLKMAEEALIRSEKKYRELVETANSIIICWGVNGTIGFVNTFGLRFFGYLAKELFGKDVMTLVPKVEKSTGRDLHALVKNIALNPDNYIHVPNENITKNGDLVWVAWTNKALRNDQGEIEEILTVGNDITALKQVEQELQEGKEILDRSLAEKEVLLKEIHHRVKNNMQVISSLISLQSNCKKDANIDDIFKDLSHRVRSMAMVHEKLYQSNDLANINFADYIQSLLRYLWKAHGTVAAAIRLQTDLSPISLPVHIAVPCGLIVNELVNNALKHAFSKGESSSVRITLKEVDEDRIQLVFSDDGIGLPSTINWRKTTSMGLRLIHMLTDQLQADVQVITNKGTTFIIIFDKTDR